jgi:DNA-binding beta-propeller fold protein YncE
MRLGLIGGTNETRTTGVFGMGENVALQNAKSFVSRFSFDNVFDAVGGSAATEGFDVSRDGHHVYIAFAGNRLTATIRQYNCSTPWDLSTITDTGESLIVGDLETAVRTISISDDGTRLFFGGTASDTVFSCTLSTPFDLATATFDFKFFYVGTQSPAPNKSIFGDSGTKMYVLDVALDTVFQYNLSTAWDVNTATYATKSFSVTSQEAIPFGLFFKSDGLTFYAIGETNDTVYQYTLTTAWDISTASYAGLSFSIAAQELTPRALYFRPDGAKMYVIGTTGDDVNEYDLSTAWNVSTASFVHVSAVVGEAIPTGLWFKDDGTKMYVTGQINDTVREFTLSTAWDVSTISFSQSLSIAGFDILPTSITFKDDGTVLYVVGTTADVVCQIPLGTAWDISTARDYLYLGEVETNFRCLQVTSDGTLLYASGNTTDTIRKYTLSTPFDLGTATATETFVVGNDLTGFQVSADGRKIYVTFAAASPDPAGGRSIRQITMTAPHDLSTGTLSGAADLIATYGLTGASSNVWRACVSPDGTRMFVLTDVVRGMYQFSLRFA